MRILRTNRLTLMAANPALIRADLIGRSALEGIVQCRVGETWPPDLYDRTALEHALQQIEERASQGWSLWYLIAGDGENAELIGICGFKSHPDAKGSVEISYSVLQPFRGQGLATEAVSRLVAWAFSHQQVSEVSAETLAHLKSSLRVLEKCGFVPQGSGSERGVVRYAVFRPDRR